MCVIMPLLCRRDDNPFVCFFNFIVKYVMTFTLCCGQVLSKMVSIESISSINRLLLAISVFQTVGNMRHWKARKITIMVCDSKIVFHLFLWIFLVGTNGTVQSECYSHNILLKKRNTVKLKIAVRHFLVASKHVLKEILILQLGIMV